MDLDGPYDHGNVFARILRGELPCAKVYEDDQVLAILDAFPQAHGHTLVLPKAPARNLLDIEPEALTGLMVQVQRIAHAIRAALNPDGLTISQFNGAAGGQTVPHLHVHIIPRWHGTPLGGHGGGATNADDLALMVEEIRAKLANEAP